MKLRNTIMMSDSYKVGHWMQNPEGTEYVQSYGESRGSKYGYDRVVFFGLQAMIKEYWTKPITMADIDQAQLIIDQHLGAGIFNRKGWVRVVEKHKGLLPVRVRAVKEGSVMPTNVALYTIENTDPEFAWMPSYLETTGLRGAWYGTTVATNSYRIKQEIKHMLEMTADSTDSLAFALHDFGYRGVSSEESAMYGALAHLINFMGTDTMAGLVAAMEYYRASGAVGYSVIASEHSTMCANANADLKDDTESIEKMVSILERRVKETGAFQIVSAVADTYDTMRFAQLVGTVFKDRIEKSGGRFVVRPDSGDPVTVPIDVVTRLMKLVGYTVNSKGYKVLPPYIRVLQGDGINYDTIHDILFFAEQHGLSAENFVFGMGGALLQDVTRDDYKFAQKASAICVNGVWRDVFKDPITDPGKKSKKGRLTTVQTYEGLIVTKRVEEVLPTDTDLMEDVFVDGVLVRDQSFDEIRELSNRGLVE
jgi:nicotinamide phosphoribosyltransferase